MLGLYRPTGRILYGDTDLSSLSERQLRPYRRDLQMVFQDPLSSFNPRFTIGSSLSVPLRLHGYAVNRKEAAEQAADLIRGVGLDPDYCSRFPHQLSGGQLQRVAIARALGIKPRLIVADEAVSKLDVSVRAQVLNLIRRANRENGVSFVFITHDLAVARFLSDRIAVMYGGRIVEVGETSRIFEDPQHPYTANLINARKQQTLTEPVSSGGETGAGRGCNFVQKCGFSQDCCVKQRPTLRAVESNHSVACFWSRAYSVTDQAEENELAN
jgi:peptide/nickel transport system ATP-binding protein